MLTLGSDLVLESACRAFVLLQTDCGAKRHGFLILQLRLGVVRQYQLEKLEGNAHASFNIVPRVALISDLHGNVDALEAVFQDIGDQKAVETYCLGDIVGYGAAPAECLEIVRERCTSSVMGNHDFMTVSNEAFMMPERVGAGIRYAKTCVSPDQMAWLGKLPLVVQVHKFTFVHSSLESPDEFHYLFTDGRARAHFKNQMTTLCFIGHTHVPQIATDNDGNIGWGFPDERPVRFGENQRSIINVGSVGQPRDGDPRASYGIFDTERQLFVVRRVGYDIKKAQARIRDAGLPEQNAFRLALGK